MAIDKKQKGLIALTVVALGFLGYQIFQLVSGDMAQDLDSVSGPTATIAETKPEVPTFAPAMAKKAVNATPEMLTRQNILQQQSAEQTHMTQAHSSFGATMPTTVKPPVHAPQLQQQKEQLSAMAKSQREYLKMINEYELVKMKRQLLDEKAAIANAENKIIVLNKKNGELAGTDNWRSNGFNTNNNSGQGYQLSYIDKQNKSWSATLSRGNQYQTVAVGTLLPGGFTVTQIDHKGVVLQKQKQRMLVSFNGVVALPDQAPITEAEQTKASDMVAAMKIQNAMVMHAVMNEHDAQNAPAAAHVAVGRHGIAAPAKGTVVYGTKAAYTLSLEKRAELPLSAGHVSASDRDSIEAADSMVIDSDILPLGLHLRSVDIHPMVHDELYQPSNYLPPEQAIPQTYQLIKSEQAAPARYDAESADNYTGTEKSGPSVMKKTAHRSEKLAENNCRLLHMSGDLYTIQLIGSLKPSAVNHFVATNDIQSSAMQCVSKDEQHRNWYMAMYGTFPSFADAAAALVNLPTSLRADGAWVRKVASIQREVKHSQVS